MSSFWWTDNIIDGGVDRRIRGSASLLNQWDELVAQKGILPSAESHWKDRWGYNFGQHQCQYQVSTLQVQTGTHW